MRHVVTSVGHVHVFALGSQSGRRSDTPDVCVYVCVCMHVCVYVCVCMRICAVCVRALVQVWEILATRGQEEANMELLISIYNTARNEKARLHREALVRLP